MARLVFPTHWWNITRWRVWFYRNEGCLADGEWILSLGPIELRGEEDEV